MGRFRLLASPAGFHWVLDCDGIVHASGPVVSRQVAQAQLALLDSGRAPPSPQLTAGGWVYAFIGPDGRSIGQSTATHADLDACVEACIEALAATRPASARAVPQG